jgi:PAS domain-containing protein
MEVLSIDVLLADTFLQAALTAVQQGRADIHQALDTLPVPIYITSATGTITYFNRACVAIAGRRPRVGRDRWCVTWKLYREDGQSLPHDQCPMAVAIKEKRTVRGVNAVARRPDGSQFSFQPYPTLLFDEVGNIACAINMFVNIAEQLPA